MIIRIPSVLNFATHDVKALVIINQAAVIKRAKLAL
jgi:hypothetical protein